MRLMPNQERMYGGIARNVVTSGNQLSTPVSKEQYPEMILGEMKTVSGRFGEEVTCVPFENADLSELLSEAVANIHGEISDYEVED